MNTRLETTTHRGILETLLLLKKNKTTYNKLTKGTSMIPKPYPAVSTLEIIFSAGIALKNKEIMAAIIITPAKKAAFERNINQRIVQFRIK